MLSNKDGSYHSQNFVFSIKNFLKLFTKKKTGYSKKYLQKMKTNIGKLETSKGRTIALLKLYTDAPDAWKERVKIIIFTMVGKLDPEDLKQLQACVGFGDNKRGKCNLKL